MSECRGFKNKLGTTIVSLIAKVTGAVAGNIATFNSDGEIIDSGKAINSVATKSGNIIGGHLVQADSNGNIVDSGKGSSSFLGKVLTATENNIAVFDSTGGIKDADIKIVTSLPSAASKNVGDEYLYIGESTISKQFGQVYKCANVFKGEIALNSVEQDIQAVETAINFAKTKQTITGYGKYILTNYSYSTGGNLYLYIDLYPINSTINIQSFSEAVKAKINEEARTSLNVVHESSFSYKNEWVPKYTQEYYPRINVTTNTTTPSKDNNDKVVENEFPKEPIIQDGKDPGGYIDNL